MQDMPYFMTNPEWFYFDGERFRLTKKAPEAARASLRDFYEGEAEMGYGRR